jgi:hypothetical protein
METTRIERCFLLPTTKSNMPFTYVSGILHKASGTSKVISVISPAFLCGAYIGIVAKIRPIWENNCSSDAKSQVFA